MPMATHVRPTLLKLQAATQDAARTTVTHWCELPSPPVSFKRLFDGPALLPQAL